MTLHVRRRKLLVLPLSLAAWMALAACRPAAPGPATTPASEPAAAGLATTDALPAAADDRATSSSALAPTSAADPAAACPAQVTSADQEGPYYSTAAPERETLREAGMPGRPILLSGWVFDEACRPLAGARLDFWHADTEGQYDNEGYRLRGQVRTGSDGAYRLDTISPTAYTGRPPHIHLKVFDPDGAERLTTQLYFPGAEDSADVAQAPDLLVALGPEDGEGRAQVRFNIRLAAPEVSR